MEFWKNQEFYIGKKLYSVKESSSNNGNWWGKSFIRLHSTKMLIKLSRLSFNKILRRKKCLFVLCLVAKRNWRTEVQFGSGNFYHEKSKPSHPKSFGLVFFFYLSKQKHHERIKKKNSIQNFIFLSFLLPSQCCQKPNGGLTFYSACRSGRGKGEKICTWKALGKCSFSWHDPYHVMKSWSHEVRKEVEFDVFTWSKHEKTSHLAHELWGSENRFGRLFSGKYSVFGRHQQRFSCVPNKHL